MTRIRASSRLIAIILWTILLWIVWQIGNLILFSSIVTKRRWRSFILPTWSGGILRIMAVRLTVDGAIPAEPFILVSNHLSYIDILLYLKTIECCLIAKSDVRSWPVIGTLAHQAGTVFIDRQTAHDVIRVDAIMTSLYQAGESIVFFPEGTSSRGATILPFRSALLSFPAKNDIPVHFASVSYITESRDVAASHSVCWWGDMTFVDHFLNMLTLPRIDAALKFGPESVTNSDRKALALELHRRIQDQFSPVYQNQSIDDRPVIDADTA